LIEATEKATDLRIKGRIVEGLPGNYNCHRCHTELNGTTPASMAAETTNVTASFPSYRWETYCHDLFQLPVAA
jgi:cytochrome c